MAVGSRRQVGRCVARLGEVLKEEREARGFSLEDVRKSLNVPQHYIQAMETSNSSMVSDEIYLVPFLRRYAVFLEMDASTAVARYVAEVARRDKQRTKQSDSPPTVPLAWWLGGMAALAIGAVATWVFVN